MCPSSSAWLKLSHQHSTVFSTDVICKTTIKYSFLFDFFYARGRRCQDMLVRDHVHRWANNFLPLKFPPPVSSWAVNYPPSKPHRPPTPNKEFSQAVPTCPWGLQTLPPLLPSIPPQSILGTRIWWRTYSTQQLTKTSQELWMLSPSLCIQRSQCNCSYCCSQLSEM